MISKIRKLILYFFLFSLSNSFLGQDLSIDYSKISSDSKSKLKRANGVFNNFGTEILDISSGNTLYRALAIEPLIDIYLEALEESPDDPALNFRMGVCYIYSRSRRKKALKYFLNAYKRNKTVHPDVLYYIGIASQTKELFDKAINKFNVFLELQGNTDEISTYKKDITIKRIKECKYAKKLIQKKTKVRIFNLGKEINSKYDEHSPLITRDNSLLFFTSTRPTAINPSGDIENIYESKKTGKKWKEGNQIKFFEKKDKNTATSAISQYADKMIIYRESNFYGAEFIQNQWQGLYKLSSKINSKDRVTSCSLSPDGKTLFFVRENYKERKGKDIYVSRWNESSQNWSAPSNLGKPINTKYDEESVFIHADKKTLYFSSNGHKTIGGYDIFYSIFNNKTKTWSEPKNIGYPINSVEDELGFIMGANMKYGYLATHRDKNNFGERDIYGVKFLGPKRELTPTLTTSYNLLSVNPSSYFVNDTLIKTKEENLFIGIIVSAEDNNPLEATIDLFDLSTQIKIISVKSNKKGEFLVLLPEKKNYGIIIQKSGFLYYSENVNLSEKGNLSKQKKIIKLQPITPNSKLTMNNIFYKFDSPDLEIESFVELVQLGNLMKENPNMVIELSAHSDSRGSEKYNQTLSNKRANTCKQYLIDNFNIPLKNIKAIGYGESQPKISDSEINKLKTKDETENAHKLNRRTEIKVISI